MIRLTYHYDYIDPLIDSLFDDVVFEGSWCSVYQPLSLI